MHTEAFTQRSLYTEELLHTKAFAHSKLLHTQGLLHREVFTQRSFLHTEGFTQRSLYPIAFAHKRLGAFTHRSCYTKSLHRYIAFFHSQTRLRTEAFTQRSLYTESFTHGSFYTQWNLYTDALSHREAFTHRSFYKKKSLYTKWFLHTETFTHKSFYTEKSLHRGAFTRSNQLKLAAVVRDKLLAGAFGNSLAPQKSRLFPTKFLFHELFSKNIRNIFLKQVPIQKLSSPHCDEMEGREIRRSRRGASALKISVNCITWI